MSGCPATNGPRVKTTTIHFLRCQRWCTTELHQRRSHNEETTVQTEQLSSKIHRESKSNRSNVSEKIIKRLQSNQNLRFSIEGSEGESIDRRTAETLIKTNPGRSRWWTADNFREKSEAEKPAVQSPERKRGRRSQKPNDHRRRRCDVGGKSRTTTGEEGATPETKPVDGNRSRIESPNDRLRISGKTSVRLTSISLSERYERVKRERPPGNLLVRILLYSIKSVLVGQ